MCSVARTFMGWVARGTLATPSPHRLSGALCSPTPIVARLVQVLMSDVVPDGSGKFLKVKFIQRKDCALLESAYLMDEGSAVSWTPNSEKLASEVGVKLASYSEDWYGNEVSVVEMDGAVDKLEEIIYLESQLCNTGTKFYGELTEQIVKNKDAPGSDNGTGLMQTLCSFKIREVYEKLTAK